MLRDQVVILYRERDAARAEVERLKVENQSLRDGWKANNEAVTVLTDDLARVRAAADELITRVVGYANQSHVALEISAEDQVTEIWHMLQDGRAALEGR